MRDYRDAKNMAHTLREALAEKHCKITVGESLELVAHMFGISDWNTLSALIKRSDAQANASASHKQPARLQFAAVTEAALRRSLSAAADRGQSQASVEHLLLSLTEDPDAMAVMKACGINPPTIRELLARSLEGKSSDELIDFKDPTPSAAFKRVVQRAILELQAAGGGTLTGADICIAIFTDHDSAAARMLEEHGFNRARAVKFVSQRRT